MAKRIKKFVDYFEGHKTDDLVKKIFFEIDSLRG